MLGLVSVIRLRVHLLTYGVLHILRTLLQYTEGAILSHVIRGYDATGAQEFVTEWWAVLWQTFDESICRGQGKSSFGNSRDPMCKRVHDSEKLQVACMLATKSQRWAQCQIAMPFPNERSESPLWPRMGPRGTQI